MFIKKVDGPRAVTLEDGTIMTRADLPPRDTRRWVASRKAAVVKAVNCGLISEIEACERYQLSEEELGSWEQAILRHGEAALKTTSLQKFRGMDGFNSPKLS
jgi:hypothetical protein